MNRMDAFSERSNQQPFFGRDNKELILITGGVNCGKISYFNKLIGRALYEGDRVAVMIGRDKFSDSFNMVLAEYTNIARGASIHPTHISNGKLDMGEKLALDSSSVDLKDSKALTFITIDEEDFTPLFIDSKIDTENTDTLFLDLGSLSNNSKEGLGMLVKGIYELSFTHSLNIVLLISETLLEEFLPYSAQTYRVSTDRSTSTLTLFLTQIRKDSSTVENPESINMGPMWGQEA
jgi:hypothetical protein